ncbi:hypothetical protein BTZ20_2368 [Rhodococcus sp. MTM3W5.2]|nr:hypothetical protein BTZ20_2368 [Rhodococcus sp. MTM3W5.2]
MSEVRRCAELPVVNTYNPDSSMRAPKPTQGVVTPTLPETHAAEPNG